MKSGSKFFVLPDPDYENVYVCLMSIGATDFTFRVSNNPIFFEAETKLAHILAGKEEYIEAELKRSTSVESFCQKILNFVSKLTQASMIPTTQSPSRYFKRILDEIREIGWEFVSHVDSTISFVEIEFRDPKDRKIEVRIDLPPSYPRTAPNITANLPVKIPFDWNPQSSRIVHILEQYRNAVPSFDSFWTQMESIDEGSYVIEPKEPSLGCCTRRIVLTQQVQLQIEVNPRRPMGIPKISFIGAEQQSKELRERFESNVGSWQVQASLKENLEEVLGLTLPTEDDDEIKDSDFECAICYMERLGSELPEVVCDKCSKRFHRSCLVDWLRTRRDAEQSFQVVFGACPYCNEQIQCTVSAEL